MMWQACPIKWPFVPQATRALFGLGPLTAAGLLIAVTMRPLDGDVDAHRKMQTLARLEVMGHSLHDWVLRHGQAPSAQELVSVLAPHEQAVLDGWGNPLIYQAPPVVTVSEFNGARQVRTFGTKAAMGMTWSTRPL